MLNTHNVSYTDLFSSVSKVTPDQSSSESAISALHDHMGNTQILLRGKQTEVMDMAKICSLDVTW